MHFKCDYCEKYVTSKTEQNHYKNVHKDSQSKIVPKVTIKTDTASKHVGNHNKSVHEDSNYKIKSKVSIKTGNVSSPVKKLSLAKIKRSITQPQTFGLEKSNFVGAGIKIARLVNYKCHKCDKFYINNKVLLQHSPCHDENVALENIPSYQDSEETSRTSPVEKEHFNCPLCDEDFDNFNTYTLHMNTAKLCTQCNTHMDEPWKSSFVNLQNIHQECNSKIESVQNELKISKNEKNTLMDQN